MLFQVIYAIILFVVFSAPVVLAVSMFGGVTLGAIRPFWFVVLYWLIVLFFPNASFGHAWATVDIRDNIYIRGANLLFLPAVNWMLIGLAAMCMVARHFKTVVRVRTDLALFMFGWCLILVGNVIYGATVDYTAKDIVSEKGIFNFINLALAIFITISCVRDAQDVRNFVNIFLAAAVLRGIYGVARFIFKGGDPANAYANIEKIAIKITFFDINDGLIATVAAFIAGWRLMQLLNTRDTWRKAMYFGIVALQSFVVLFAFRRTGWIGFIFAAILFALTFKGAQRRGLFALYLMVGIPALLSQGVKRMVETVRTHDANFFERLAPDIFMTRAAGEMPSRWLEWAAAWDAIKTSPVIGLGTQGAYNGWGIPELDFRNGDFTWLHSGFLHVGLKAGLVGWFLLFGMWVVYFRFVLVASKQVSPNARMLMFAGLAGTLFYMPTWLLGTPVIEYRTMQLQGLLLALPYLAYALSAKSRAPARQPVATAYSPA